MRRATANAEIMLHGISDTRAELVGLTSEHGTNRRMGLHSQSVEERIYGERQSQWQTRLIGMMAKWTGNADTKIAASIKNDLFLTAEQAQELGVIDSIL